MTRASGWRKKRPGRDGLMTPGVSNFSKELVVRMGLSPAWFIRSSQKCIGGKSPSVYAILPS